MNSKFRSDLIQNYKINGNVHKQNYSDDFIENIFGNKLQDNSPWINSDIQNLSTIDPTQKYIVNSLGYRSPEFASTNELIFAGCSHTYGIGVPEETIWGSQIAEKLSVRYSNLSYPGVSTQWIVRNLFAYFKKFGNPKTLICLFPDFSRAQLPLNSGITKSKLHKDFEFSFFVPELRFDQGANSGEYPKYSKKPHFIEDVIPMEVPMYLSAQAIHSLISYCREANIDFHWSTWSDDLHKFLKLSSTDLELSGFVDLKIDQWHSNNSDNYHDLYHEFEDAYINCNKKVECSSKTECHIELLNRYKNNFYAGTDNSHISLEHAHFGIHKHAHIAEEFLKALENSN